MDKKDDWLIAYVKAIQADGCTTPEIDARAAMAIEFGISENWAYELIRQIVQRYPQFHLEKVGIMYGDGKTHPEWELTWRD